MLTFNRPHYFKEAVERVLSQTYSHLELIIIDNASTPETQEYLSQIQKQDSRIKVVRYQTNQYDPNEPGKYIGICFNAALKVAQGEYVFYQEDDDLISPDYIERMVALFQDNPQCTTAAGIWVSIDAQGKIIPESRISNFRPRYMPGHLMALDTLKELPSVLFSAPGTIFTIRRDVLLAAGGYHPIIESSQMYGIVPFGVTGFDEKAVLYWRRHPGQLNLTLQSRPCRSAEYHRALLKEWDLHRKWEEKFGKKTADHFVRTLIWQKTLVCADSFISSLFRFSWKPAWGTLSKHWNSWYFWKMIPQRAWINKWLLKKSLLQAH